jgi:hypothetical protein
LAPGIQAKYVKSLNAHHQLTNGTYRIQASVKVLALKIIAPDGNDISYAAVKVPPEKIGQSGSKYEPGLLLIRSAEVPIVMKDGSNK